MAQVTSLLPRIFHWLFLVLEGLFALGAIALLAAMAINPHLPPGTHFGPAAIDFAGTPGSVTLRAAGGSTDFLVSAFRGNVTLLVTKADALIELLKRYGLPVLLLNAIFFAALFDLLRRLFRNVGRADSFSQNTVRLVQAIAGLLIGFSFVSAFAERLFSQALMTYIAAHSVITITGTPVRFPAPHDSMVHVMLPPGGFPFGSPLFFSGLLVLALSEVFRQGLALKRDSELTI